MVRCRVCEEEISYMGWAKYVEAHKRRFCKEYGIDLENYHKIPWETVVKQYNPTQARHNKSMVRVRTSQRSLDQYQNKKYIKVRSS